MEGSKLKLKDTALQMQKNAYAPYSNFKVGAAIKSTNGYIFGGANVENAAYPEGTCAEAGAIASMIRAGERRIKEVYVVANCTRPVPPCGGCRQKLVEFGTPDVVVTLATLEGREKTTTLLELLPGAFTPEHLDGEK